jgi:hypothetical protein
MLTVPNHPQTFKEIIIVGFSLWKKGAKTVLVPVGITSFLGIILAYVFGLFLVKSMIGYLSIFVKSMSSYFSLVSMLDPAKSWNALEGLSTVADLSYLNFGGRLLAFVMSFVSVGTILNLIIFAIPLALMIYGMHKTFTDPSAIKKPRFFDSASLHLSDLIGYNISYKKLFLFTIACLAYNLIVVVGFIFFFVPGIIASLALFFTPYLFITGEYSVWGSMKASAALFSQDRWLVIKRVSVFVLISLLGSSFLLTAISTPDSDNILQWFIILLCSSLFHACALSLLHDTQLRKTFTIS